MQILLLKGFYNVLRITVTTHNCPASYICTWLQRSNSRWCYQNPDHVRLLKSTQKVQRLVKNDQTVNYISKIQETISCVVSHYYEHAIFHYYSSKSHYELPLLIVAPKTNGITEHRCTVYFFSLVFSKIQNVQMLEL